jgi:hypothetical protein
MATEVRAPPQPPRIRGTSGSGAGGQSASIDNIRRERSSDKDISCRCDESAACKQGYETRSAAIKRLSELSFTSTARRKKYVESVAMLYKAAALLETCTFTTSTTPTNTPRSNSTIMKPVYASNITHCHCVTAADCYTRAAFVYENKLKQSDMQYQSLILAAQLYITCARQAETNSAYERIMEADHVRQAAGLTDRNLHIQLGNLSNQVSEQLWDMEYYQRSLRALELSLSCYTRAIASQWTSELSDETHSVRVKLADKHVEYAIMLQTDRAPHIPGDTLPAKHKHVDHFQRAKELYEQAARYFPGRYLLRREISKALNMNKNDTICDLIANYAVEREWYVAD